MPWGFANAHDQVGQPGDVTWGTLNNTVQKRRRRLQIPPEGNHTGEALQPRTGALRASKTRGVAWVTNVGHRS